ncbi:MAG: hypothetical protein II229_01700, partial [Clostridia bacterium]|nr:hypothetical protein [Clostridia bacterium]
MAFNPQFKINQMAKDMGLKSKDMTELLAARGFEEIKSQKVLAEQEFNALFEALTNAHQVENIYDYMDGKTCIPSKIAAKRAAEAAEREAAAKRAAEEAAREAAAKRAAEEAAAKEAAERAVREAAEREANAAREAASAAKRAAE